MFLPSHSSQARVYMLHTICSIHGFERQIAQVACEPNITHAVDQSWVLHGINGRILDPLEVVLHM